MTASINTDNGKIVAEDGSMTGPLKLAKPVVLVGLMGAGKTTIGRRLAARLDVPFVDADAEIEEAAGCAIGEIFETFGETDFREGERKVIARLLEAGPHVLATGGGAFINSDTRAIIKATSISIWLKADIPVLVERVSRKDTRPLLAGGDPTEILTRLAAERHLIYAEADLVVQSSVGPMENVVEAAVEALKAYTEKSAAQGAQP